MVRVDDLIEGRGEFFSVTRIRGHAIKLQEDNMDVYYK